MVEKRFKFPVSTRPLLKDVLVHADVKMLATLLRAEHPQTITIVLAHLDAKRCGETLKLLPVELHSDVLTRMAKLDAVDPRTLDDLAESMTKLLSEAEHRNSTPKGGVNLVASLLTTLDKASSDRLLKSIGDADPTLKARVSAEMFLFQDLAKIDDRGLQELLKHVPNTTLMLALKTAPEAVRVALFRNMSERGAASLKDDIAAMGKVPLTEVEAAQRAMADMAVVLQGEGRINIPTPGDRYV